MTKHNCPQTALIHAPRQAPQYIETIQPPLFRASTIIFKTTTHLFDRHWTDAYDYSYGTHGLTILPKSKAEIFACLHQVVYQQLI